MPDLFKVLYSKHPNTGKLSGMLESGRIFRCHIRGLPGSSASLFVASVLKNSDRSHLFIMNDKEQAAYFFNDLQSLCSDREILFFPSSWKRSAQGKQDDAPGMVLRTEVLDRLTGEGPPPVIVTYPAAIAEKVLPASGLKKLKLQLRRGESVSREFLVELLNEYQFRETDFVYEPGEFAIRGSIIDVFSYSCDQPFRIDFFGNEVESIRVFDIESQLSEQQLDSITLIPNVRETRWDQQGPPRVTLVSLMNRTSLIWANDLALTAAEADELVESGNLHSATRDEILRAIQPFPVLEFGLSPLFESDEKLEFNAVPQPTFNKNFELLTEKLKENIERGFTNYIFSESEKQLERLRDIFAEIAGTELFNPVLAGIHAGFTDNDLSISCYTDHQIFERYHKYRLRENFKKKEVVSLKTLHELKPGDYVVHIDHGIGIFGGLEKIDVHGKKQEALKLVYKDGDTLFVSIHSLHRISRYKGKEGVPPKIYKLGSGSWQKLKEKTKNKVKDIARELIALYAKRRMEQGFRYSADSYLQRELEASFIYEDTPDQLKATDMVKEQMESSMPMDVLVCGDVGFGKTEIAIRAAFKAVSDSKQVAVLVPTTILAMQHYNTFTERLKDFPCTVDHISRLKTAASQKEILGRLEEGKLDILIGTHRLIGKDVKFRDLGLLIIDEEQKFGVSVKEKLKKIRLNVDTLTLTATPIPRTLQFSLMGARDLAIINTPPPNRHPIITELHQFNPDVVRDAIEYEIQRGGQVFFIHNRVQNIAEIENMVMKACPGIKTVVAHGQMEPRKLESIMLGFISGKYDVLIATTIIESGLDIPNANTIIINNAHHFGLSDLHQLRGRVGRSNKKAFCYLLAPSPQSMTKEARQRLRAIEEFSELGSGFNIAMQDLDIRGAGNLLGREQSGFIADIGFETYHRILDEAVQELRETEFSDVFPEKSAGRKDSQTFLDDCQVDTDMELLFPEEYIPGNAERIRLYKILDNIVDEETLTRFRENLVDRFGPPPRETRELLNVVPLRRLAVSLGFEKIVLRSGRMVIYFISNQMSPYYKSPLFSSILLFIQRQKHIKIKEQQHKLTMTIRDTGSMEAALDNLREIRDFVEKTDEKHGMT